MLGVVCNLDSGSYVCSVLFLKGMILIEMLIILFLELV